MMSMKPALAYSILAVLGSFGQPLDAYAQKQAAYIDADGDSIQVISGMDTLQYKRVHRIEFPTYTAESDSLSISNDIIQSTITPDAGLGATGSISRGIQVSSNASVSLQSSMYLKIKGSLSEDYEVSGVLSEKTSPLQPIGNTRRLNDFDRVIINVVGPTMNASVGDIDLRFNDGRFGKFERSIEGLHFDANIGKSSINTSLGFSYGKYHLLQIQGKDGKQGPYRLSGKNGEKFIIILAGSEKIRLDDKVLERGENGDYIIDYNAAEVTFTQKRILSSNSRISVEFEYVPDIYLASYSFGKQLMSAGVSLGDRRQSAFSITAAWRELKDDQKNPLGNIDDEELSAIFKNLPDSTQNHWVSTINPDSVAGDYIVESPDVLVYVGEDLGLYRVEFNFVGLEKGEYRKVLDALDTYFVYDTVQGEYLPAKQYIAPETHSLLSVQSKAKLGVIDIDADFGLSRRIKNLYSRNRTTSDKLAWDISLNSDNRYLAVTLGDKYYTAGFGAHDALETNEYYRRWQVSPRVAEQEHLVSSSLRVGDKGGSYLKGIASQFERSNTIIGDQINLSGQLNPESNFELQFHSIITRLDTTNSQQFEIETAYGIARVKGEFDLSAENAPTSNIYNSNDHLKSGVGLQYLISTSQTLKLRYDIRRDYRFADNSGTFLDANRIDLWKDQRADWALNYLFEGIKDADGSIHLKFREHQTDSNSVSNYYLGNFQIDGIALDNRIRYSEHFKIDEEHIPKFDYHYIEVDTGYGDFSFDPVIQDYIPVGGGRFIRQRIFSDIEEQVRKYENKARIEYASSAYGESNKLGFKIRVNSDSRTKIQIDSNSKLQDQNSHGIDLTFKQGKSFLLNKMHYTGKSSRNRTTLYNYGAEQNQFINHKLSGTLQWNKASSTQMGISYEEKQRSIEYNMLASEDWDSYRPFVEHTTIVSSKQKIIIILKYSSVEDLHLEKAYAERLIAFDYNLRVKKRGRIDQKLTLASIKADVDGLPYSIFSGRQAGNNWKYGLNSRYTFSSRFQISINYSMQKRGESRAEQYLRLEGRTHF